MGLLLRGLESTLDNTDRTQQFPVDGLQAIVVLFLNRDNYP